MNFFSTYHKEHPLGELNDYPWLELVLLAQVGTYSNLKLWVALEDELALIVR